VSRNEAWEKKRGEWLIFIPPDTCPRCSYCLMCTRRHVSDSPKFGGYASIPVHIRNDGMTSCYL
jgi:hypothetical protein